MDPIVSTIDIHRPPAEVFDYVTDPNRFADWQADVVSVRTDGPHPLSVGARFTTIRRINGAERKLVQEVTQVSSPSTWAARGVEGPIRPTAAIGIEALDDGAACRVTFSLDFVGHGIGVPLLPLVRRQTRKQAPASYRRLKQLLDARTDLDQGP
jgi:uncharacterized protein YndB with AHSA1/START domain